MLNQEKTVKDKILTVLTQMRSDKYYDVPMVAKHTKCDYHIEGILNEDHIYMIHRLDVEYGKFSTQQNQIYESLNKLLQAIPLDD
jgi:hypothetical protein